MMTLDDYRTTNFYSTHFHEAGHALLALKCGGFISNLTLKPDEPGVAGLCSTRGIQNYYLPAYGLAGNIAEALYFDSSTVSPCAGSDLDLITQNTKDREHYKQSFCFARNTLLNNKHQLRAVAEALLRKKSLTHNEVMKLVN